jgi:hypothetical protein
MFHPDEEELMPYSRLLATAGTIVLATALLLGPAAAAARATVTTPAGRGILPPKNPTRSLRPAPFFLSSPDCTGGKDGASCNSLVLKAITRARKTLEKMAGMSFSLAAYEKLTPDEQLFVTVDLERVARGLSPAVVLTRSLDRVAQVGAKDDADPPLNDVPATLPGGGKRWGEGGNWAGGWENALGSDYAWMYDDGLGGINLDCSKAHRAGCWGHRDNILGTFSSSRMCGGGRSELAMGAGHVARGKAYGDSETELLVGVCGPTPTDVVLTWAKAKALLHYKG